MVCVNAVFSSSGAKSRDALRSDRPNRHRPIGADSHLAISKPQRAVPALGLHRWPGEPAVLVLVGVEQRPMGGWRGGRGVRACLAQRAVGALVGASSAGGRGHNTAPARQQTPMSLVLVG